MQAELARLVVIVRPGLYAPAMQARPLDDIRDLIRRLPEAPEGMPSGWSYTALAARLSTWSGVSPPSIRRPLVAIFAGAHGIAAHGVSRQPQSATLEAVDACASGQAPISRLCSQFDLGLKVYDLALELPTADFSAAAALDEKTCAATMAFGMEALADGTDVVCLSGLGVGGSTAAAAILIALHGGSVADWIGPAGNAIDTRRASAVQTALALHREHLDDPLEILRRLGGREIAAIAGAILAARFQSVPVALDGAAALAAAAVVGKARPDALAHCFTAARASSARMEELASALGMNPLQGRRLAETVQGPLDGAMAIVTLQAAAAVVNI